MSWCKRAKKLKCRYFSAKNFYMTTWYFFDISTIMISLGIKDLSSLHDVGSTDLTVVSWLWNACWIICIDFIQTALWFQSSFFFKGNWVRLLSYLLCSFYLVTEVINVKREWKFLCPRWPVWFISMSWRSLVFLGCFYCGSTGTISIGTVGTILIEWKMFYKIHLDTKNGSQVTNA